MHDDDIHMIGSVEANSAVISDTCSQLHPFTLRRSFPLPFAHPPPSYQNCPIVGQLEVSAVAGQKAGGQWVVQRGVFIKSEDDE